MGNIAHFPYPIRKLFFSPGKLAGEAFHEPSPCDIPLPTASLPLADTQDLRTGRKAFGVCLKDVTDVGGEVNISLRNGVCQHCSYNSIFNASAFEQPYKERK
jgi:hypothetical protein